MTLMKSTPPSASISIIPDFDDRPTLGDCPSDRKLGTFCSRARDVPTGSYADYVLVDATYRNLTLNVSYIETDISARAALLWPSFSRGQDGTGSIAGGAVVASLAAVF